MSTGNVGIGRDYAGRLNDLCQFTNNQFGVESTQMRIIAASLLHTPSTPVWLICDGPKHPFWFALESVLQTMAGDDQYLYWMTHLRVIRPRDANSIINKLVYNRQINRIFLDHRWNEYGLAVHYRNRYPELAEQCLRVKVKPNPYKIPQQGATGELLRLLKLVLDVEFRPIAPVCVQPDNEMSYAAQLLTKLNPDLASYTAVLGGLSLLLPAHAILRGATTLGKEDYQAMWTVIRDSIRPWTGLIVESFVNHDGYFSLTRLQAATALPVQLLKTECRRLAEAEILTFDSKGKWMTMEAGMRADVEQLIVGRG